MLLESQKYFAEGALANWLNQIIALLDRFLYNHRQESLTPCGLYAILTLQWSGSDFIGSISNSKDDRFIWDGILLLFSFNYRSSVYRDLSLCYAEIGELQANPA
jgi:hypothetical protein